MNDRGVQGRGRMGRLGRMGLWYVMKLFGDGRFLFICGNWRRNVCETKFHNWNRSDDMAGAAKRRVPIPKRRNACETKFHNWNRSDDMAGVIMLFRIFRREECVCHKSV